MLVVVLALSVMEIVMTAIEEKMKELLKTRACFPSVYDISAKFRRSL